MIAVVDNYDSFTFNLVQLLAAKTEVEVRRNDDPGLGDLLRRADGIVISPGPGRPEATGDLPAVLRTLGTRVPLLGVCLGHQLLGQIAGAEVVQVPPRHGKTSCISHDGQGVFQGLPQDFLGARYHSLAIADATLRPPWRITARADDGTVMGIRSPDGRWEGVQFHPESIATSQGPALIENFLRRCIA
ncbi:MAG: aminodeoxychorismate/anthranilate synthase component II [Thermaerobacter sp.]|nr:aminodeoxychorismate/anthranilate synthase component II [Thermaerobacter sp.]